MAHFTKHAALAATILTALISIGGAASAASYGHPQSGNDTRWDHMSAARASAIHECSLRADHYPNYLWGNTEIYQYRACMAEHGQQE